jgi:hypothetical protein
MKHPKTQPQTRHFNRQTYSLLEVGRDVCPDRAALVLALCPAVVPMTFSQFLDPDQLQFSFYWRCDCGVLFWYKLQCCDCALVKKFTEEAIAWIPLYSERSG